MLALRVTRHYNLIAPTKIGVRKLTDNPKPKRKPEKRENVNSRQKRIMELKPEVRGIYKAKEHHQAIKDFAKTLK